MKKGRALRRVKSVLWKVLGVLVVLGLWQGAIEVFHIKKYVLPSPIQVLRSLFDPALAAKNDWWLHIGTTASEILLSFLVTLVAGVLLALLIAWSKPLNRLIMPVIVLLNSIPKIALAPLFLLWFGYGLQTNVFVAVLVAFFPVVINTVTGLIEIDDNLLDLVNYLGAPKAQVFTKIRIPNALPHLFAGIKTSATMCVTGSIVGEFIASKSGLGRLLRSAQANIDMATMFACLLLLSCLGLLFFLHPRLFWVLGLSAAAVLLILYGLLRIPMIWEIWSAGAAARLSGILWALLPLAAGALLLFFPAQAALILIRLCGLLMCILGLWHAVSSLLSGSGLL